MNVPYPFNALVYNQKSALNGVYYLICTPIIYLICLYVLGFTCCTINTLCTMWRMHPESDVVSVYHAHWHSGHVGTFQSTFFPVTFYSNAM